MASLQPPKRRASRSSRSSNPLVATANDGTLPLDVLIDILLRVPAKPLCRFRAVCSSWQCLLCDPTFIASHAARHPSPLIVARMRYRNYLDGGSSKGLNILDMSGNVVKRVSVALEHRSPYRMCMHQDLVCLVGRDQRLRVLDPANGACILLPYHDPVTTFDWYTLGRVTSTGEYKVLIIIERRQEQVCKVLTLGGGGNGAGRWKDTGSPPNRVGGWPRGVAVVKGVAYFLVSRLYDPSNDLQDWIVAFDLETETWQPAALRGPVLPGDVSLKHTVPGIAELNERLVVVCDKLDTSMELWFRMDSDKTTIWSKQYVIVLPYHDYPRWCRENRADPLWIMDDGRIVLWMWMDDFHNWALRMYDPRTRTCTADLVEIPKRNFVGFYRGSLLRSESLPPHEEVQ